jgi:preprotein translocase subunit SecG
MDTLFTIIHIVVCLFLVGIVLLQHGKGADIGATFGGSSQSLFGSEGPLPLLNKITTGAAVLFMVTSITLAYYSANTSTTSVMSDVVKEQAVEVPVEKKDVVVPMPTVETNKEMEVPTPVETEKDMEVPSPVKETKE